MKALDDVSEGERVAKMMGFVRRELVLVASSFIICEAEAAIGEVFGRRREREESMTGILPLKVDVNLTIMPVN
jgi:regulator of protease activity HflC (stomatin/prohibitin superfamily)